jgi:hypothetical protein
MDENEALNLRWAEKRNRLLREEDEAQKKIKESGPPSGFKNAQLDQLHIEYAEKKLAAYLDSIRELIDLGAINPTREWKTRLLPRLNQVIASVEQGLKGKLNLASSRTELPYRFAGAIRQRFELMFFDEAQRLKMRRDGPISIGTLNVTGIANIGKIVGDINQSINQSQGMGHTEIAAILKELTQAVISDPRLSPGDREEALQNLHAVASESAQPVGERKMGVVKASLAYLPALLSASTDVLNYLQIHLADLQRFFGIQ